MHTNMITRLFEIENFGYYQGRKLKFGDPLLTLQHMRDWAENKKVEETRIDIGLKDNGPPCYLVDIKCTDDDNWLVVIWNKANVNENGNLESIRLSGKIGEAQIAEAELEQDDDLIYGYPTYFWVIPSKNMYATVVPEGVKIGGRSSFDSYMESFMWIDKYYVHELKSKEDTPDEGYIYMQRHGFSDKGSDIILENITPYFNGRLLKNPGEREFILSNYSKITKIINKCTLHISNIEDKNIFQKFVELLNGKVSLFARMDKIRVDTKITANFSSREDIEAWILMWESSSVDQDVDNCGFMMRSDTSIHWLNKSFVKLTICCENLDKINGSYPAKPMLESLVRRRENLLSLVQNEPSNNTGE